MTTFRMPKKAADILKKHGLAAFATGNPYQYLLSVGLGDALKDAGYEPKEAFEKVIQPIIEAYLVAKKITPLTQKTNESQESKMSNHKEKIPVWNSSETRWSFVDELTEEERLVLVREYAPSSVFPGGPQYTGQMVASLCPLKNLAVTPPEELSKKLEDIHWEHKASTPADDDEYWMAQSPFDGKFYVFASLAIGGGWPVTPAYTFDDRPSWFDED